MVDEKTETPQEKTEGATSNSSPGNKSPSTELVERARQERERLQQENERLEKNLAELKELEASRLLGSTAGGRVEAPQVTEEDLKKKQALEFWKGTPIADAISKC
jgi:hypothetical protein